MNKKLISFYPVGRYCNQLFTFLAAYSYSLKYGLECCLPSTSLLIPDFPSIRVLQNHFIEMPYSVIHKEPSHGYNEIKYYGDTNVILDGYFQSEKYFNGYRKEIIELLEVPKEHQINLSYFIHIRIGDYKIYPTKHPIVSVNYLYNAISTMFKVTGLYEDIVLFTDTKCEAELMMGKVKEMFYNKNNKHIDYTFADMDEIHSLRLMSLMDHGIISNSTFSWFGAWLINNPDKIVISPSSENWFGNENSHLSTKDLIPESWIQIKYE